MSTPLLIGAMFDFNKQVNAVLDTLETNINEG
jgi:hypothetical protein